MYSKALKKIFSTPPPDSELTLANLTNRIGLRLNNREYIGDYGNSYPLVIHFSRIDKPAEMCYN